MQLEYLVLTIQAQDIKEQKDMGPIVAALQSFIPKAITAVDGAIKHTASGAVEQKIDAGALAPGRRPTNNNGQAARPGGKGAGRVMGGGGGAGGGGLARAAGELGSILNESVKDCEFSKAYLLGSHLKRQEWSYSPADIAAIYDSVIFPYYLEVKPTELGAQWDTRINTEFALRKIILSKRNSALSTRNASLHWLGPKPPTCTKTM